MTDQRLREIEAQAASFTSLPLAERLAILNELRAAYQERAAAQQQASEQPTTPIAPVAKQPKRKLPTAKMRAAIARFDALPDDQQVGRLSELWGDT